MEIVIGFVRLGRNGKPSARRGNPWNVENIDAGVELSQIEELKHITVIIILSTIDASRNSNHVSRAWISPYRMYHICIKDVRESCAYVDVRNSER